MTTPAVASFGTNRTLAVVTGSRAEYGLYRPILHAIQSVPALTLRLIVCGMHLSERYGLTIRRIEQDGFPVAERIETLSDADTPEAIGQAIGRGVKGFAEAFGRSRPDMLVLLGDRYDMLAAASAALAFALPIAHVHGGELTGGAIDESIRHALTKMSHVHFVATERYRERVIQMGEQPDRVFVSGAPGLDTVRTTRPTPKAELERVVGLSFDPPPLLVTFHPVTLEYAETGTHIDVLLAVLAAVRRPIVFTYPNADTSGMRVIAAIEAFVAAHSNARVVKDLGPADYFGMMAASAAMIGNSSSGIIEAPSFALPVVNVGNRQRGRLKAANVIDCETEAAAIAAAIERATAPEFRARLRGMANPYGDGHAAERMIDVLRTISLDGDLVKKRFFDIVPS